MANDKDFILKNPVEVPVLNSTIGTITSSDIDLATGNYFSDALSADTTYTISNAGDVQAFQIEITGGDERVSYWDVSTARYLQNFSVSSQETSPKDIFFKPDGTKLYVIGSTGDDVNEYDLSTAWDISTSVFLQKFSVSAQDTVTTGIFFKPDGTIMYVCGTSADWVYEYDLSTAWDVSTASVSSPVRRFRLSTQQADPQSIFFKPDGTKMYTVGYAGDEVDEYDLSTAWNVTTSVYSQSLDVRTQEITPSGVFFKPDGAKMYIVGSGGDEVNEYNLSTAWDISTAVPFKKFNVFDQETVSEGLFFKPDGTKMYIIGASDNIHEYDLTVLQNYTITWPSSVEWADGTAPVAPDDGQVDLYTFVTDDSGTSYIGIKSADNLS